MPGSRFLRTVAVLGLALALAAAARLDSPVADAAMRDDAAAVRALVKQGADVNAPQPDGMTALHWAARHGRADLVKLLAAAGAHPEPVTRNGAYTPLHLASRGGHVEAIRALLRAGARPGAATSSGGATPLHFAALSGSPEAVAALLDGGADANAREGSAGQTPLMWAASRDQAGAVRVLLQRGANPALQTALVDYPALEAADQAARKKRDEIIRSFRPEGTEAESWNPSPDQVQAAVQAAQRIQTSGAPRKAEEGTKSTTDEAPEGYISTVGVQGGMTALLHAVREGNVESVKALLDAGADVNQPSGGDHSTPLLTAAINGHFDLAVLLLERGADPNRASDAGTTPLFAVVNTYWHPKARYPQQLAFQQQRTTYLEAMKRLLEAGADPNLRLKKHLWFMEYNFAQLDVDISGATPFWRAAYALDVDAMKLLVAHGADPGIATLRPKERRRAVFFEKEPEKDASGLPPVPEGGPGIYPIHAATGVSYGEGFAANSHRHVPDGWLRAVKYLVEELGADVNARDYNGYNAIHHAASRGDNEVIRYLVSKGGDVKALSRRGQTTADMANGPAQRTQPYPETIRLLESLGSKNNHRCLSC